jgi:hypothetical protein
MKFDGKTTYKQNFSMIKEKIEPLPPGEKSE